MESSDKMGESGSPKVVLVCSLLACYYKKLTTAKLRRPGPIAQKEDHTSRIPAVSCF